MSQNSVFLWICPQLYIFSRYLILSLIQERNNFLIGCIVRLWIIAPLEIQKTEIFFFIDNKFKNGKFLWQKNIIKWKGKKIWIIKNVALFESFPVNKKMTIYDQNQTDPGSFDERFVYIFFKYKTYIYFQFFFGQSFLKSFPKFRSISFNTDLWPDLKKK